MALALESLTAHNIGQATDKKDHRQDQKKDIKHVRALSPGMVAVALLRSTLLL
jgi:hypothetical protein